MLNILEIENTPNTIGEKNPKNLESLFFDDTNTQTIHVELVQNDIVPMSQKQVK